jgi:hypothetical protein
MGKQDARRAYDHIAGQIENLIYNNLNKAALLQEAADAVRADVPDLSEADTQDALAAVEDLLRNLEVPDASQTKVAERRGLK